MGKRFSRVVALILVLSLAGGAWAKLVGHWRLDETGGTVVKDSSGNGNDGTVQGSPTVVDGHYGKALAFSNNRVAIPASATLGADLFKAGFTLTAWINPKRTGNTWQQIFRAVRTNNASNDTMFLNNNGTLSWRGRVGGTWTTFGDTATGAVPANQWTHVAVKGDGSFFRIYINGVLAKEVAFKVTDGSNATHYLGGAAGSTTEWYNGMIDDARLYDAPLTLQGIQDSMLEYGPQPALDPDPANQATDVPTDVVLAWKAGRDAATHDVYLGTTFNDVNTASRANPAGVLASQGQADAQYRPQVPLEYGQTYYWRVDEVNKAPDNTIFRSKMWSFTVEPYSYPVTPLVATASSFQPDMDPNKTIDGSGLTGDLHDAEQTTMWLSSGVGANWIQYEFDKAYRLYQLQVWNSNQQIESLLGFGAKTVTIEVSTDGTIWTAVPDVPEFNRAPGAAGYAANTTVSLGGVEAKYVKLTITANWGGLAPSTGLAEVRFSYIPVRARAPQPADAATNVGVETAMEWRPGREATSHTVYFGTDPNAVADGIAPAQTVADHAYAGALNLDTTYYWRVDEVGAAATYPGDVWSFTTQQFLVVDDFESYTDEEGARVYETWLDGSIDKSSGSIVGLFPDAINGTFCETTIIHGGKQSMPLAYGSTAKPYYSEATLNFATPRDWTAHGIKSLSLWFRGVADNTGQLYVKINGVKMLCDAGIVDVAETGWQVWNIDLSQAGNVGSVRSLISGIEGTGAKGTLYVDDVRLYPNTPELVVPVQPDEANLVARYTFDADFRDSVGSHDGTPFGDAKVTSDPVRGQVLMLDATGDWVEIPYSEDLNPPTFTVSLWAYADPAGANYRSPITSRDGSPARGYILYISPTNTWQFWTGTGSAWHTTAGPAAALGEWTHVAATFANDQKALYINGRQVAQNTGGLGLNTQRPVRIGAGATEGNANYLWRGLLDDVRLYNRDLSAAQVAGLAGRTKPLQNPF